MPQKWPNDFPEPNAPHPSFARVPTAPWELPSFDGLPTVQVMFRRSFQPRSCPPSITSTRHSASPASGACKEWHMPVPTSVVVTSSAMMVRRQSAATAGVMASRVSRSQI
ncbi:hypothetical protein N7501_002950 [Penicillium viridicatum]|nr:hypothetical protein N7501_002950 [Penicillium viridicatum]